MKRKKAPPKISVENVEAFVQEARTRMPFRYGSACLTAAPILHVRVTISTADGAQTKGIAADCLPPLWFDKDTSKNYRQNVDDQIAAFKLASGVYARRGATALTVFDLWQQSFEEILSGSATLGINALTSSFGSSFLERAVIDAVCRHRGVSLRAALEKNLLGLDTAELLPPKAPETVWCRHTVGLADPITRGEIPDDERLDDGLPQALEEDIEFYGLRYFKVKVCGERERDLDRLSRMAALFAQRCENGFFVTLDGNEQYRELAELESLLEDLKALPYGDKFFDAILFIEQPLHRDVALQADVAADIARLSGMKPVIIDESDDLPDSFSRAVEIGYRGVSHKNCKGIFKSLENRRRVIGLNEEHGADIYFQSAEDLANVAVVPLQADLATLAALGIDHAERNGHHYYHGLDHLPAEEAQGALAAHGDLYEESEGSVVLKIVDGAISVKSVVEAEGYGYACAISLADRTPLEDWSFDRLGL